MTYQDITSAIGLCFNAIGLCLNILTVIGVVAAFWQVRSARDSLRAQVFMKLFDEWKNPDLYKSIRYIDLLRQEWKQKLPVSDWDKLANEWVKSHVKKDPKSQDPIEKKLAEEWYMRRMASQFLSKMGSLVEAGYLPEDDFFGVNPEVGRQLSVLIPIEIAIQEYWKHEEQKQIAPWDYPVPKWEFTPLWNRYQKWYRIKGSRHILLPINWPEK